MINHAPVHLFDSGFFYLNMPNKIASIILNSAKASGLSDVYVAQPDAVKENLAGKIFLLAEISGKKSESRKIFDFLILALTDNYYNDEKILFRDKIEGLKLENIFEAAITKTNKDFGNFLSDEKIKINPDNTSITLGVIYENKLHFANFGRNRALLIYRHGDSYDLINVEANASESEENKDQETKGAIKTPQLFSSVISGEIPASSYFIFASEALPEYLSGSEMINIITKLPPMTAAQQIKNILGKINAYVPFLGIIIKNTTGLVQSETMNLAADISSAQSSISSLNYTEQKTEQMLSPAGLINFSKIFKNGKKLLSSWLIPPAPKNRTARYRSQPAAAEQEAPSDKTTESRATVELGRVQSLKSSQADSFLIKEKMFFRKKSNWLLSKAKKIWLGLINLINPQRWPLAIKQAKNWIISLNLRNRWLFAALGIVVVVFIANMFYSSWKQEKELAQKKYEETLAALETKEDQIDFYLLYNDEEGANRSLLEAQALLSSLPAQGDDYQAINDRLKSSADKVQKISRTSSSPINDLTGMGVRNLIVAAGKIYASSENKIYELTPNSSSTTPITINESDDLSTPMLHGSNLIGYLNQDKVIQFNPNSKTTTVRRFSGADQLQNLTGAKIYSNNFYSIHKPSNQIFRFSSNGGNFSAKTDWLKESADLSQASDLAVDGRIYILNQDGKVMKFNLGKAEEYKSAAVLPTISDAKHLLVGSKNLYFLSPAAQRLVVLDKETGILSKQYLIEDLNNISDFTIDEQANKAYLLDNEQVYEINL